MSAPRLGVLGAGQLGSMIAQAALPLGVECVFFDPTPEPCVGGLGRVIRAPFDDRDALDRFADQVDVVTLEFENVPVDALRRLSERVPVRPGARALDVAQDRATEKTYFRDRGIATAPFLAVDTLQDLEQAIDQLGLPAILKARRLGYDGKGQLYLAHPEQAAAAWAGIGGVPCIVETVVAFDRELSLLAARSPSGQIVFYPLVENRHAGGVLRWSHAPAVDVPPELQARAEADARGILESLDYVGVLAIEWFQQGDRLLANEMAPRVHNSGHFSIEGAATSQFENHVRAVLDWPLGATEVPRPCAMVNLLGSVPPRDGLLAVPGARLHDYGKVPRLGRKLGHVTITGPDLETVRARTRRVRDLVERG